jgi:RNA polymerase sigma-70 factor (family 1)
MERSQNETKEGISFPKTGNPNLLILNTLPLIEGLRSGRESAYRQLFEQYYQKLVVFAYKYLENLESARDVVQDLFVDLYDNRQSIAIQTSLKSYLYSAVNNRCLNLIKHEQVVAKHRKMSRSEARVSDPDLEEMIDAVELEAKVYEIVSKLPYRRRQIYIMSRVDGKPNREIAEALNLSIRTVETQISKALKSLKNSLLPL